jgi:hypothetical protein
LLSSISAAIAQVNPDCINADPSSVLAGINGDFELLVDPQDRAQNVIYISNVGSGASSVVVAHINGLSGQIVPGSLHVIADNYQGNTRIKGPEYGGELGILYSGPGGVHGAFRHSNAQVWYNLSFDLTGAPTNGSPPQLPTSIGAYPWPPIPLGQHTYWQYFGNCSDNGAQPVDWCYGALGFGVSTDVKAVLSRQGFSVSYTIQSPRDGYIFISACGASDCGLFEGKINHAGGLVLTTVLALTQQAPVWVRAPRTPQW